VVKISLGWVIACYGGMGESLGGVYGKGRKNEARGRSQDNNIEFLGSEEQSHLEINGQMYLCMSRYYRTTRTD
jgi:hypothetical protein